MSKRKYQHSITVFWLFSVKSMTFPIFKGNGLPSVLLITINFLMLIERHFYIGVENV